MKLLTLIIFILIIAPLGFSVNAPACPSNLNSANTVYTMNSSKSLIDNVACYNITATNVTLDCSGYAILQNSTAGRAVRVQANNVSITNCVISNFTAAVPVLSANGNSNLVISNSVFSNDSIGFISVNGAGANVSLINISTSGSAYIDIRNSFNSSISNSIINSSSHGHAVYLGGSTRTISNTTFYGTFSEFLDLSNANNVVVSNSTFIISDSNATMGSASQMFASFTNVTFNNTIFNITRGNGIIIMAYLFSYSQNLSIFNSKFYLTNSTAIILDKVSNSTIYNNTFQSFGTNDNYISFLKDTILGYPTTTITTYANNFTSTGGYFVNDTSSGNFYNYSYEGNVWADVLNGSVNILGTSPSQIYSGLYSGWNGTGYPYNTTMSSKIIGSVVDYRPLTVNFAGCGELTNSLTLQQNLTANGTNCFNITASNIVLNCNNFNILGNNTPSTYGILSTNNINVTVKNCIITNFSEQIEFNNTNNSYIQNNILFASISNGIGVKLSASSNTQVINNTINSSMDGISVSNGVNNSVVCGISNIRGSNADNSIGIYLSTNSSIVLDCYIEGFKYLIYLKDSANSNLSNIGLNSTYPFSLMDGKGLYISTGTDNLRVSGINITTSNVRTRAMEFVANSANNSIIDGLGTSIIKTVDMQSSGAVAPILSNSDNFTFKNFRIIDFIFTSISYLGNYGNISNNIISVGRINIIGFGRGINILSSNNTILNNNSINITSFAASSAIKVSSGNNYSIDCMGQTLQYFNSTSSDVGNYIIDSAGTNGTIKNCILISNSAYATSGNRRISLTGTGNSIFNNTLIQIPTSVTSDKHIVTTAGGNIFYWNNFTSTGGLYVQDTSGSNFYNYSVSGQQEGNIYPDVINSSVLIDGTPLSIGFPSLYTGIAGSGYPYNISVSSKFSCNFAGCGDYAPLTPNAFPVIVANLSFVNATTTHWFTVNATASDANGASNVQNISLNYSSGTCIYVSNSTSGTNITGKFNCSNTMQSTINLNMSFYDGIATGVTNTVSRQFPDNAPTITAPSVAPTNPTVTSILTCNPGTFSDIDGDVEDNSSRVWTWYKNGSVISGQTSQTLNLGSISVSKGNNISCSENTTALNWTNYAFNISSNVTINNSAPTIIDFVSLQTTNSSLYLNCSASDTDGGTDISFSNVTSTNGTVLSVSNGTSGTSFWSTWNVTGLNQLTTINTTCIIKDSSNISVNQTSSFTTSSSDSYSNPVQVGSAPVNTLVLWNVTYTANGDPHNCSYTYVTSQVNSSASYVLDSLSQGVSSTLNPTNITWNCTSSSSPYAIYISSVAVTVNTSSVGGSTLGENAVIYQHTYNGTIPINFLFTSSYPSNAISRSLWRCTLDNISRCDAANSSQWIAQTYTETGSFTLSRTYSIVTSNLVLVTTYSTSIPGGGGGSGGIVGNLTSIFQFPASNETIAFAKATEETLVGAGKSLRYDVFGIEFYWYIIIICIGIFVNETRKTKTLLSPNKITGRQALSAVIALLLFTLYGVLGFLPKTPEDGKFTLDVGLSNIISSISNLIHGTILGVELNIWAGLVMILYAVSKIISRKVNIGVIAIFIAGTIVIALPSILKI